MQNNLVRAKKAAEILNIPISRFRARVIHGHYKPALESDGAKLYDVEELKKANFEDKRYRRKTYTAQDLLDLYNKHNENLFAMLAEVLGARK